MRRPCANSQILELGGIPAHRQPCPAARSHTISPGIGGASWLILSPKAVKKLARVKRPGCGMAAAIWGPSVQ
jgi:hypothetical protein